jgi:hypothetical protein
MTVSMNLNSGSKIFDETATTRALEGAMPLVEEMCAYLLKEKLRDLKADHVAPEAREAYRKAILPQVNFNDGGFRRQAVTRYDFERLLAPWKVELGRLMLKWPRREGSTIASYFEHLRKAGSGDGWWNRFDHMKLYLAHIARIDDEERAEREREAAQRRREEQERRERERAHRAELEREASPDPKEIQRLESIIEDADNDDFLAKIRAAEAKRDAANAARRELQSISDKQRDARSKLASPWGES